MVDELWWLASIRGGLGCERGWNWLGVQRLGKLPTLRVDGGKCGFAKNRSFLNRVELSVAQLSADN
jgi:hypothetical protein